MFIACNTCNKVLGKRADGTTAILAACQAHALAAGHSCSTHDVAERTYHPVTGAEMHAPGERVVYARR